MSQHDHDPSDSMVDENVPVPKKGYRSRYWFLTWNNYTDDSIKVLLNLSGLERYCVQEEVGDSGTPHLQGVLCFKQSKSGTQLNLLCNKLCWFKGCRNIHAAKNYCSKVKTRSGKQWVKGFILRSLAVKDPLDGKELYKWQKEIIKMVREVPDDRKVYWYWSAKGNVGKSVLCKHMVLKEEAIVVGGSYKDAYYAIAQRVVKKRSVNVVVFSLTRFHGNKIAYIALEGIKDGMFFSPKYESGMCVFNPPHVLVFANAAPDLRSLSADRWVVKCLDKPSDVSFDNGNGGLEGWRERVHRVAMEQSYGGININQ